MTTNAYIEVAAGLLETMRGDRDRIQWMDYPDRTAAIVKLSYLSGVAPYTFAKNIGTSGATITYFEQGLSSTKQPWYDIQQTLKIDTPTLFRTVGRAVPELADRLNQLAAETPALPEEGPSPLEEKVDKYAQNIVNLRSKYEGRILWTENREMLDEIRKLYLQWIEEGNAPRAFFNRVNLHQDVFRKYFGADSVPTKKVKVKKVKKPKKAEPKVKKTKVKKVKKIKKVKKPKAETKEATAHVIGLSELLQAKFEVGSDGSLTAHVPVRLLPGTEAHTAVLRHRFNVND